MLALTAFPPLPPPVPPQVKLEDAGFDWKILGPDVQQLDYTAWQADQVWGRKIWRGEGITGLPGGGGEGAGAGRGRG